MRWAFSVYWAMGSEQINVMTKKEAIIVLLILIVALFQVAKHRDRIDALENRVMVLETQLEGE